MVEFRMPSLGADMESGFLREWRVKPGDSIKKGDIIAEVETQKGIIEIEVFDEGVVGELLINVDDKVPVGTLMTHILTPEEANISLHAVRRAETRPVAPEIIPSGATLKSRPSVRRHRASPLARKIAADKGIDLSAISGTGPEGAVLREDVEKAIAEKQLKPGEKTGAENIRMAVAAAMSKSNREIPHYYLQTKIDMQNALQWLAEVNRQRTARDRILPVALLIKAVAKALREAPALNGWWENGPQLKEEIHVGFVVSLRGGGIIVPAIHHADTKSVDEIMKALSDLIPRARALKLRSSELADSTITVTSLGDNAVDTVFGVIYPPQVALVGFGGIHQEPWAEEGMLGVRPVIMVSLSADHRATDGSTGNLFLTAVKKYLSEPETL